MNMKAVIVWIIAIIIFAGIGLFGMANQHLLDEKPTTPTGGNTNEGSEPSNVTHNVTCTAATAYGNSSYIFTIDDSTNSVTNVAITYQATSAIDSIYASANNLASSTVNGVTTSLTGTVADFYLSINVSIQNYDSAMLANYQNDLTALSAVVENLSDVETYKNAINGTGNVYTCN